jgi:hypothetical protein
MQAEAQDECPLKDNPTINFFANMDDELYNVVKATNPTLKMLVDVSRQITSGEK